MAPGGSRKGEGVRDRILDGETGAAAKGVIEGPASRIWPRCVSAIPRARLGDFKRQAPRSAWIRVYSCCRLYDRMEKANTEFFFA